MKYYKNIYFCFVIIFSSCVEKKEKINFYLPNNFNGNVVLIYNCVEGIEPTIKNNVKEIFVPNSGIVKIKQKIKFGITDYNYFKLQNNTYLKLNVLSSIQNNLNNEYYVGPGSILSTFENNKNTNEEFAFIFYVHKFGENILSNYSDKWILDTLKVQKYFSM